MKRIYDFTGHMKLLHEQQLLPVEILETISLRYGTPAFIAFETLFQKNCQDFLHDFRCGTRKVTSAYSYKTNNLKAFCRIAHQEGLCAEVVSSSELDMALSLGLEGTQVYYNGPYKSEASLRKAVAHSVAIHVDSIEELDSIDTIARSLNSVARVALRLTPLISDQRGLIWSKFGLSDENGEYDAALTKIARAPRLELEGLHMHIGTNLTDPIAYELAAERLAALAIKAECQLGHALKYIDVGGGFSAGSNAIPLVGHPEEWIPVSIAAVSTRIAAVLDRVDPERRWSIVVEPGRVIAESAMVLLSRVVSVKERGGAGWLLSMPGPTSYQLRIIPAIL